MNNNKNIPKLRFPQFQKDGEWEEKTIDKIKSLLTDYVANGSFKSLKENVNVSSSKGYAYYVRLTDLRLGLGHSTQKYVDKDTYSYLSKSSLSGGELLMANIGANVGEVWQMPVVNKPSTLAPNMIMVKFDTKVNSQFVFYYLTSEKGLKAISSVIAGSGHPKINKTDLKQVKVSLAPSLPEQKKIASCLSSLDELITAHTEKLTLLQEHKKGLMQNLFPKEGKKVPAYRFSEFRNDGEWVEKKLGEVGNIITGSTPSTNEKKYYNGKYLFVSPADITNHSRYIIQTKTTLTPLGFEQTRHIAPNSILFVCIGSTIGKVAQNKVTCSTNQQINSLIPHKGYSADFLYSLLEQNSSKISELAGIQAVYSIEIVFRKLDVKIWN